MKAKGVKTIIEIILLVLAIIIYRKTLIFSRLQTFVKSFLFGSLKFPFRLAIDKIITEVI